MQLQAASIEAWGVQSRQEALSGRCSGISATYNLPLRLPSPDGKVFLPLSALMALMRLNFVEVHPRKSCMTVHTINQRTRFVISLLAWDKPTWCSTGGLAEPRAE